MGHLGSNADLTITCNGLLACFEKITFLKARVLSVVNWKMPGAFIKQNLLIQLEKKTIEKVIKGK